MIDHNEDYLSALFPSNKKAVGRPRVGAIWIMPCIVVFGQSRGLTWADLALQLRDCQFLIDKKYLRNFPKKSTLHQYWQKLNSDFLRDWILCLKLSKNNTFDLAGDSPGDI